MLNADSDVGDDEDGVTAEAMSSTVIIIFHASIVDNVRGLLVMMEM